MYEFLIGTIIFLVIALGALGIIICRVDKIQRDNWNRNDNANDTWDK